MRYPQPSWAWAPLRVGGVLIAAGVVVLVQALVRFVVEGTGTPAPVAPAKQPQQPDGEVAGEPTGQPDELAVWDGLAAPTLGSGGPQLGAGGRVELVQRRAGQPRWVHRGNAGAGWRNRPGGADPQRCPPSWGWARLQSVVLAAEKP